VKVSKTNHLECSHSADMAHGSHCVPRTADMAHGSQCVLRTTHFFSARFQYDSSSSNICLILAKEV
jgi:hypothetical protein